LAGPVARLPKIFYQALGRIYHGEARPVGVAHINARGVGVRRYAAAPIRAPDLHRPLLQEPAVRGELDEAVLQVHAVNVSQTICGRDGHVERLLDLAVSLRLTIGPNQALEALRGHRRVGAGHFHEAAHACICNVNRAVGPHRQTVGAEEPNTAAIVAPQPMTLVVKYLYASLGVKDEYFIPLYGDVCDLGELAFVGRVRAFAWRGLAPGAQHGSCGRVDHDAVVASIAHVHVSRVVHCHPSR
jgi:hypothetical protein